MLGNCVSGMDAHHTYKQKWTFDSLRLAANVAVDQDVLHPLITLAVEELEAIRISLFWWQKRSRKVF